MTNTHNDSSEFILKATCSATGGIIAAVTSYLWSKNCYISELNQFDDSTTGRFFMRSVCQIKDSNDSSIEDIKEGFDQIGVLSETPP